MFEKNRNVIKSFCDEQGVNALAVLGRKGPDKQVLKCSSSATEVRVTSLTSQSCADPRKWRERAIVNQTDIGTIYK